VTLWRIGHRDDPAGFVPLKLTSWENRWDDPQREFRTSYAAEKPATALVEVFQGYRPTVQAQTTRGDLYPGEYLYPSDDLLPGREHLTALLGPSKWATLVLASVEVEPAGRILDLIRDDRGWFEREIPDVLQGLGVERVDTNVLTNPGRRATQQFARAAYDKGISGFRYPSNAGEVPCVALFEGRGNLKIVGPVRAVSPDMAEADELIRVDIQLIAREEDDNTLELSERGKRLH
jgi:RES domain